MVYGYLVKRLTEPVKSSDAYGNGHIDEYGNEIDGNEDWSYTKLDRLVFDLRSLLGPNVSKIADGKFADIDTLSLMTGNDTSKYDVKYMPVVSLVEEAGYLPESTRGFDGIVSDDSPLSKPERVQFALTVATFLMYCLKKDRMVLPVEFDEHVLGGTEATFGVRSIGSYEEIFNYLKKSKLVNSRDIENSGIVLATRLAVVINANQLCIGDGTDPDDMSSSWGVLARHGR